MSDEEPQPIIVEVSIDVASLVQAIAFVRAVRLIERELRIVGLDEYADQLSEAVGIWEREK